MRLRQRVKARTTMGLTLFVSWTAVGAMPAAGPLRVGTVNPRYFTVGSGQAVYLTGSHTWANLQDIGLRDPPPAFDFPGYLDFLERHHHNFVRLWCWEFPQWAEKNKQQQFYCTPQPWQRTGPGEALDGKPKFDLERFHEEYFERLRSRVVAPVTGASTSPSCSLKAGACGSCRAGGKPIRSILPTT